MKYLTLIRHAKSSWDFADLDDMVRPLNQRGKEATTLMGHYIKSLKIKPDVMISSPATRALHTALNIASWLGINKARIDIDKSIYFGGTKAMVEKLSSLDSLPSAPDEVFLFGHEPYMSELVHKLTGDEIEKFPTCAFYRIALDAATWSEAMKIQGTKDIFVSPKMLMNKS